MIRTFLWFFTLGLVMLVSIPFWIIAKIFPTKNRSFWPQLYLNIAYPLVAWVAGFKVEIVGKENIVDGPALYVGNHQGLFDMLIALAEMGPLKAFLAKKEAEKIPMISSWMKMFGCIFIDRQNVRSSLESLTKCEEFIAGGGSMIIFPEGTRSRCHEMGEFKPGSFRPALKTGAPIVPFVIDGTYHAWEEDHKIRPTHAKLTILPPIETKGMEKDRTKRISEEVHEQIKNALG